MSERDSFINDSFGAKDDTQFFGKVPKPLELAFIGVALGAPVQYRREKTTGLDQVCMLVPNRAGFQPVMVTFGKEDSVGKGSYEAICHQLNLKEIIMVNNVDMECTKILTQAFFRNTGYGLRKGNGYQVTILQPKFDELDKRVQDIYPEHFQAYSKAKMAYLNEFNKMFASEEKKNKESKTQQEGREL